MAKKNKGYSLEDYIAGISLDEFEKNQTQLKEKKPVEESTNSGSYNLLNEMTRKYNEIFCSDFQTKKYLYYAMLLKNGYATTMTIEPNTKYAKMFDEIKNEAKSNNVELWTATDLDNWS